MVVIGFFTAPIWAYLLSRISNDRHNKHPILWDIGSVFVVLGPLFLITNFFIMWGCFDGQDRNPCAGEVAGADGKDDRSQVTGYRTPYRREGLTAGKPRRAWVRLETGI